MALYAFNCYDKDGNIYSIVAEVEYDREDQQWDVSYNACWINGEVVEAHKSAQDFNRANNWQAFNRAIDEACDNGGGVVFMPTTDPTCAQFVADCENADRITFKDLRTTCQTPAIDNRRANLETRAIKIQRQLKGLATSLAFPIDGEPVYKDNKIERVMWAINGFKYAGAILMHTLDAERIYSEVIAEMNAEPVKITLHETT